MYKLIVGLGNPGEKYKSNRHNLGFMAINTIAQKINAFNFTNKFQSEFAQVEVGEYKVILLKPQTYMNNSGIAIRECANFYKIPLQNILVIHDELDLETGRIRIKIDGGNGGHNGLKSIDQNVGSNYYRLRFGIARPEHKSQVSDYVLSNFERNEVDIINFGVTFIAKQFNLLLAASYDSFLNNYAIEFKKNMEKK